MLFTESTFGQEEDSLYISPKNFILDDIIISANRWEQNLREVPGAVSRIPSALIQLQNPQTAADLLGASNHVFIQKSQLGGGSPMIRGFSTNRVLLVIDGVRMNNAIFRSGNVQNVISLDANAIHEAEVVFGPGSVIYGSDAIGGVMDFHTLKPTFGEDGKTHFKTNALARYASANHEKTGHVDFSVGWKKWALVSSITKADYEDLRMGSRGREEYTRPDYVIRQNNEDIVALNSNRNIQRSSGYDQLNLMQKVSYQPEEWWNITYAFHYSKTSSYSRYDRLILRNHGLLANAEWYYGPQQWIMHSLTTLYTKPLAWIDQARVTVAYQDYEESRHNRRFNSARRTNRFENVKAFSANLDLDKKLTETLTVFYGGEFVTNKVSSRAYEENIASGEIAPTFTRYPDGAIWQSYAAYLSLKLKLHDKWLMTISNRFTKVYTEARFDNTFFDFPFNEAALGNRAVNGAIGFIYNPSRQWKIFTNLSSGFRAPNVDDIGKVFDSQPGFVVVPNPNLKPELAYNAEASVAGIISDKVKADFAIYYTLMDNAIARAPSTFNARDSIEFEGVLSRVLALQNISEVYIYGVQAGIDWQITKELKLTSSINYQTGKEKDPQTGLGYPPTHVAPLFGALHLIFSHNALKLDLYSNYNGAIRYENLALTERADAHLYAKDKNGNPYAPSWVTANLKGSYRLNKYFSFDAGVENILDKRYRPYASGISAPGRNFTIGLRGSF